MIHTPTRARLMTALTMLLLAAAAGAAPGEKLAALTPPYEADPAIIAATPIDALVEARLAERGIEAANLCSDEVFVRRVYLDVIGTLPEVAEVRAFLRDPGADRRARLIDALLERDEFAEYWALKWGDLLRIKAEFPINLWPNAVQAYHRWTLESLRENKPYDQFARELLTSSGSNFRVGPANFYRAVQGRTPESIAAAVGLTLMGTRLEGWPEAERKGMEAFFTRVAYKKTAEWKEEIVYNDMTATQTLRAVLPGGKSVTIAPGADPRLVFADWLIADDNPWFARNIVNRVWAWLNGRGIIEAADDIRADNPPSNPELLAYLEKELVAGKYDLRRIYRLILNSRTYQRSSIPRTDTPEAAALFAAYRVRRLDAEVLIDAISMIAGSGERYESPIPEPFTYIPDYQRSIQLSDGSITSQFLEMFGRPSRDTGEEAERGRQVSDAQRLHMLNSSHIQKKIEGSWRLRGVVNANKKNPEEMTRQIYLMILSRNPTPEELATVMGMAKAPGAKSTETPIDLAWALINSKEFLYRH
jgi:hypothetical protein